MAEGSVGAQASERGGLEAAGCVLFLPNQTADASLTGSGDFIYGCSGLKACNDRTWSSARVVLLFHVGDDQGIHRGRLSPGGGAPQGGRREESRDGTCRGRGGGWSCVMERVVEGGGGWSCVTARVVEEEEEEEAPPPGARFPSEGGRQGSQGGEPA